MRRDAWISAWSSRSGSRLAGLPGAARENGRNPRKGDGENDEKFFFSCYLRRKKR
jgi:hypothetical protein